MMSAMDRDFISSPLSPQERDNLVSNIPSWGVVGPTPSLPFVVANAAQSGRVGSWATNFEKLLHDPVGLQTFAVSHKPINTRYGISDKRKEEEGGGN